LEFSHANQARAVLSVILNKTKPVFDQLSPSSTSDHRKFWVDVLTVGFAMLVAGSIVAQTAINPDTQGTTSSNLLWTLLQPQKNL
jgi:hypothetical protein